MNKSRKETRMKSSRTIVVPTFLYGNETQNLGKIRTTKLKFMRNLFELEGS